MAQRHPTAPIERSPNRTLWTTAALVAGLALVVAVLLIRHDRPRVFIVGDSITSESSAAARAKLRGSYIPSIDGRPGYRVDQQLEAATAAAGYPFTQVIINLGTNDVMTPDQDLEDSLQSMARMVSLFTDADCIHLVTVNEQMIKDGTDAPARARRFNDGVRQLAAGDARIGIVEWSELVRSYEATNPGELVTRDTVHPNQTGREMLVAAYEEALDACG